MTTLLVVHHAPSPRTQALLDAAIRGLDHDELSGITVESVTALRATADHVLAADGYLFFTPANFGYMSGALKHFFDTVYYTCLSDIGGRPYAACVHGDNDAVGASRAIEKIAGGMSLEKAAATVEILGEPTDGDYESVGDAAATVAAHLVM